MLNSPRSCVYALSFFTCFLASKALAFQGLVVSEVVPGGDVTVPGEYPVLVPREMEAYFSSMASPQVLTLTNRTQAPSVVRIQVGQGEAPRTLRIGPGNAAVFNSRGAKPIQLRAVTGDIQVNSLTPLTMRR